MLHRKFHRLARALGSKVLAVGTLEMVWAPCYESGSDYLGTSDDVENAVEWAGKKGALTRALVEAGFIDAIENGFRVHDLLDHAPEYVAGRRVREREREREKTCAWCAGAYHNKNPRSQFCTNACRVASWRARTGVHGELARQGGSETVTNGSGWVPARAPTPAPAPAPAPAPSLVRTTSITPMSVGGETPPRRSPPPEPTGDVVLSFPVDGVKSRGKHAGLTVWALTTSFLHELIETYQTLNVADECQRALMWLKANPSRRKTFDGMPAFLNNWMSRAVNMRRGSGPVLGSLKTAGNRAALAEFYQRHPDDDDHKLDE
jgi:hypothetical protein